jgi:hypothetical protein
MLLLRLHLLPSLPMWLIRSRERARNFTLSRIPHCVMRLCVFSWLLQAVACIYVSSPSSSVRISLSTNYHPCRDFKIKKSEVLMVNPLNAKLNPIFPLLALFGAHHILHVSRQRVKFHTENPKHDQWLVTRNNIISITYHK